MPALRRPLALVAAATCVALGSAGCGENDPSDASAPSAPAEAGLSADEQRALTGYDRQISRHCVRVTRSLVDPARGPTEQQEERAFAAAEALIALAAAKPTAQLGAGQDTRLFLSDVIENLGGSNCDPRMIAVLSQGLAEIPLAP